MEGVRKPDTTTNLGKKQPGTDIRPAVGTPHRVSHRRPDMWFGRKSSVCSFLVLTFGTLRRVESSSSATPGLPGGSLAPVLGSARHIAPFLEVIPIHPSETWRFVRYLHSLEPKALCRSGSKWCVVVLNSVRLDHLGCPVSIGGIAEELPAKDVRSSDDRKD